MANRYGIVGQGICANGTLGRCTGSPVRLVPGSNTVTITTLGDFTVTMPVGTSASAANGSATLVSNPTTCAAAAATTVTSTSTGTMIITVTYASTGLWNNTYSWSASSGGVVGASVPTSSDAVIFDSKSFGGAGETFTVNATASCLSMDFTAGRFTQCKKCRRREQNNTTRKYKTTLVQYKGGKCEICGYDKCVAALDFHHLDPSQKDTNWIHMRRWNPERVKKEVDKCQLVCRHCHSEIHYNQGVV